MATLTGFGTLVCHLPDHPLHDVVFSAGISRHELACLFSDIKHDRTRLKYRERSLSIFGIMIHQGRHSVVGVNRKEMVSELVALTDIAFNQVVLDATFFQLDGDFLAIWCGPVV